MISGGMEVNLFTEIRLTLKVKFGNDPEKILGSWILVLTIFLHINFFEINSQTW